MAYVIRRLVGHGMVATGLSARRIEAADTPLNCLLDGEIEGFQ